ncbi:MAG: PQQ-dependent sugar dehydrogenase, partial [Thermoleophilia bacterium]|nr:PQQ-dependent sugar dehydrogenase [Thermoleophilia bacterium]
MRAVLRLAPAVVAALVLAACGGEDDGQPPTQATETAGGGTALDFDRVETVATGLEVPWALAFLDERTLLVTERPGRVRVIADGELRAEPALELDVIASGEAGLLGIAAHPSYPRPPHVFLHYTAADGNRISRFRVADGVRLRDEQVALRGIPATTVHAGGALAFGPDGLLYAGTGDAGTPQLAADRTSLAGKVLRLDPDGAVPEDNPFSSPVFAFGLRNPQGLAWGADDRLYASEHGPSGEAGLCCHDEVNAIEAGGFYGWPLRAGRTRVAEGTPPAEPVDPLADSGADTTWAPAGVAVDAAGAGDTSVLVATLRGERLLRFAVGDDGGLGEPRAVLE